MRALACSGPEQHGHSVLSMPIAHLAGFRGVLQVDGYGGYKVMAERGEVRLTFCWSHAPTLLRARQRRPGADRKRGADPHRRPVPDRERDPRPLGRGASHDPAGAQPISCPGIRALAARETRAGQPKEHACRDNPICALGMDGVEPLPRRRPHRDRFERATVAPGIPTFNSPVRLGV